MLVSGDNKLIQIQDHCKIDLEFASDRTKLEEKDGFDL